MKRFLSFLFLLFVVATHAQDTRMPLLKISPNKRFFQTADNKPFFWLGDTGWLLFTKLTREEVKEYLDKRKQQGFNVIQVMMIHDLDRAVNVYGDAAFSDKNVTKPLTTKGNDFNDPQQYDYWDHIDYVVNEAGKRGLYMAMVPIWGSNVKGGSVSVEQAEIYASFIALRYNKMNNVIWLNGGDIRGDDHKEVWNIMAQVLHKYDLRHMVTYHPRGRTSSSEWFHNQQWLDFNMFQSGHRNYAQDTSVNEKWHFGEDNWRYAAADYARTPIKPVIDGEPSYENIPQGLHDSLQPRWTADDIRRYAYWSVFAGAAGFTYGENAVMQFHKAGDKDANYGVNKGWKQTIDATGATQMKFLSELILSFPYEERIPAQSIIFGRQSDKYNYLLATKGKSFALIYTYTGINFSIQSGRLGFTPTKVSWFSPATGIRTPFVKGLKTDILQFDPPGEPKDGNDWVLIIE